MNAEDRVRDLVRRVARRVLAERGLARFPEGRVATPLESRVPGLHVEIHPAAQPLRPSAGTTDGDCIRDRGRGADLVTRLCIEDTPDGGSFGVERGTIITDLAREEAWRRRIELNGTGDTLAERRAFDDRFPR